MMIKVKVWRSLSQKEKFDLLLEHANLNVLGRQVVKEFKRKKISPTSPIKWRRTNLIKRDKTK